MRIRALTRFISQPDKGKVKEAISQLKSVSSPIEIWTRRIAFPPTKTDPLALLDLVDDNEVKFSLLHLTPNKLDGKTFHNVIKEFDNVYGSILLNHETDINIVVKEIINLEPDEASRVSVLINNDFLTTPYFPAGSANNVDGIGASLLYVESFMRGTVKQDLLTAEKEVKKISSEIGSEYLGLDPSLSPWMDDSVGRLIERRISRLFSPSNLYTVRNLNSIIERYSKLIKSIGFKEVMLPLGEDSLLMKRVKEGRLGLYHFVMFSQVCVAGVDMIPIKSDMNLMRSLLLDLIALHKVKKRPIGARVIPVSDINKHEVIHINGFGDIPIVTKIL
ncbi:hypothetical protein HS7_21020 [Sulfolobales archaeon HS-7]|nr:hypothetical protein HS7_21020 [Sulfolobales archaeon HS-7]